MALTKKPPPSEGRLSNFGRLAWSANGRKIAEKLPFTQLKSAAALLAALDPALVVLALLLAGGAHGG